MRVGDMVKSGGSQPMMIVRLEDGVADCTWIDEHGDWRDQSVPETALMPMRTALAPKTMWPEGGDLAGKEVAKERLRMLAERKKAAKAAKRDRRHRRKRR